MKFLCICILKVLHPLSVQPSPFVITIFTNRTFRCKFQCREDLVIPYHEFDQHHSRECPKRQVRCEFCDTIVHFDVLDRHKEHCVDYLKSLLSEASEKVSDLKTQLLSGTKANKELVTLNKKTQSENNTLKRKNEELEETCRQAKAKKDEPSFHVSLRMSNT